MTAVRIWYEYESQGKGDTRKAARWMADTYTDGGDKALF